MNTRSGEQGTGAGGGSSRAGAALGWAGSFAFSGKGTHPSRGEQNENLLPSERQQNPQPLAERGACAGSADLASCSAGGEGDRPPAGGHRVPGVLGACGDPPQVRIGPPSFPSLPLPSPLAEFQSTAGKKKKKKKDIPLPSNPSVRD